MLKSALYLNHTAGEAYKQPAAIVDVGAGPGN